MTTTTALNITGLDKRFGGVHAVRDLTLAIPSGAIFGILGPNGSGKTTVFNLISGFTPADAGAVKLFDVEVAGLPPHRLTQHGMSRTFQNLRLFSGMTVLENVLSGGYLQVASQLHDAALRTRRHIDAEAALRNRAREVLTQTGLLDRESLLASQLPYGAARRLEIARALMAAPRLLLLDEPAAGMNPNEANDLIEFIRSIRDSGVTVMVIEHNVRLMITLCDRIAVLDQGMKIAEGIPTEIVNHPAVIEAYLGIAGAPV